MFDCDQQPYEEIAAGVWERLLESAPETRQRECLRPLATHCIAHGVHPPEVTHRTLHRLWSDLDADASHAPVLEQIISSWNECMKRIPRWPAIHLSHPSEVDPYLLPLSAFPSGFRDDVVRFEAEMSNDPYLPPGPERERFLQGCRVTFCRAARGLTQSPFFSPEDINELAALLCGDAFPYAALFPFLPYRDSLETHCVHSMAIHLRAAARYLRLPDTKEFDELVDCIAPDVMRARDGDLERLAQFRDPAAVRRLLQFPGKQFARARQEEDPVARAETRKSALAVSLLIYTGLSPEEVRQLRFRNAREMESGCFIWAPLGLKWDRELQLSSEADGLLGEFLGGARERAEDQYLFPAANGGAMSREAFREMVSEALQCRAGLDVTPDSVRPIVAKVVLERAPSLLHDVYLMFGVRPDDPIYEVRPPVTEEACLRVNRVLEELRGGSSTHLRLIDGGRPD
jgi:integrase